MRTVLPHLREIGFRLWDPLGLRDSFEGGEPVEDEYDSYLLRAFAAAVNSNNIDKVIQVLKGSETAMGVGTSRAKRNATAAAILQMANIGGKTVDKDA